MRQGLSSYIAEGEPLTLDLPNRKASIYTSSHFYLHNYPNAPEPLSDTPLPHTSINPALALNFETADEGNDGVPFPRPRRCGRCSRDPKRRREPDLQIF